jgi:hypothetical protein
VQQRRRAVACGVVILLHCSRGEELTGCLPVMVKMEDKERVDVGRGGKRHEPG